MTISFNRTQVEYRIVYMSCGDPFNLQWGEVNFDYDNPIQEGVSEEELLKAVVTLFGKKHTYVYRKISSFNEEGDLVTEEKRLKL